MCRLNAIANTKLVVVMQLSLVEREMKTKEDFVDLLVSVTDRSGYMDTERG